MNLENAFAAKEVYDIIMYNFYDFQQIAWVCKTKLK